MIEVSDLSFDSSQTYTYTLSIRRLSGGFCFAVFNNEKKLLHFLSTEGRPEGFDLLKHRFATVHLLDESPRYTLVPRPAFREDLREMYWNVNFKGLTDKETLMHDSVRLTDVVNLYAAESEVRDNVESLFSQAQNIKLIHRQSVQMTIAVMRNKQANCKQLFIHLLEEKFDVLLMDKGSVILANTYPCRTQDEFLYHVLNIFNQVKLDPYATFVLVGGASDGREVELLSQYVENVSQDSFLMRPLSDVFAEARIPQSAHVLFNLPFAVN